MWVSFPVMASMSWAAVSSSWSARCRRARATATSSPISGTDVSPALLWLWPWAVRWVGLAGMNATETADYIAHHLKIAGRADTLFSADAITLIHNASRGYPRAINNLAVNALTAAFARDSAIVDEKAARIAISETGAD